jgi:hypothetical protein
MASFDEVSRTGAPEPLDGVSRLTPEKIPVVPEVATLDREQLRLRAAEARMRTMELIVRYLALSARGATNLERSREMLARIQEDRAALSASVARYALLLRALGEPPERTLILIKTAFSEAAPRQDDENRAALESVVKWFVEAYYAA